MNSSIFLGLINNAALLLALGLLYDLLPQARDGERRQWRVQVVTGLVLGAIAIVVMLTPWTMVPGLVFDTRSVLLSISGLFFGTLPTVVAMLITGGLRLYMGGSGAAMGIAAILTSGLVGIAWRHWRRRWVKKITVSELYAFGVVVHVVMLLCTFLLPWPMPLQVLPQITPAVMLVYPVGVMLLGVVLAHRQARRQAADLMHQREERYRTTLMSIGDGVIAVDAAGRVEVINQVAEKLTGWSAVLALGQPLSTVLQVKDEHTGQVVDLDHLWARPGAQTSGIAIQAVLTSHQGVERPIDTIGAPILSEGSQAIGAVLVFRDQTYERSVLKALHDSEEKYRLISENAGDVIWMLDLATQRFSYMSPSVEKLRGYTVEEVLNQTVPQVMTPDSYALIQAELPARLAAFLAGDHQARVHINRVDQIRRDGSIVPTEVVTTVLTGPDGLPNAILGVSRDISERIRVENSLRASQARLRESEERWQFALEGAGDGVWDWNPETGEVYYSPQWKAMLGYEDHEIGDGSTVEWDPRVHPDDLKKSYELFERHLRGELPLYVTEFRMRCKDGKYKWILGRGRVIKRAPDGRPLRVIGTHTDISERKQIENERQATIELLSLINAAEDPNELLKALPDFIKNWSGCQAVSIRMADGEDNPNPQADGFSQAFHLHASSFCMCAPENNLAPDEKDWLLRGCGGEACESLALIPLRSGKETLGLIQLCHQEKDRFSPEMIALFERLATHIANFLARKKFERELRASEERFLKVFRASPVGISMIDLENSRFSDVNEAFLQVFGYQREELIGRTPFEMDLFCSPAEWIQMVELLRDLGEIKNVEIRIRRKSGEECEALVLSEMIEVGGLQYVLMLIYDISDRKQAEQQIRRSLHEKEILLRELYHRTKNNMQVIRAMLVLQFAQSESEEVRRLVKEMDNKIQSMALVHQMLYQSHSLDRVNLHLYIQDLAHLIVGSYRPATENVRLNLNLAPVFVTIEVAIPVGLILNELLSNACKHAFAAGQAGEITISLTRTAAGAIWLVVADNGRGVPPGFDLRGQQSYGLTSIFSLAEHQLGGQVVTTPGPGGQGLVFDIQFSDELNARRV